MKTRSKKRGVPEFGFGAPSVRPQILKEGDYGSQRPKGTKPHNEIPNIEGSQFFVLVLPNSSTG